MLKTHDCKIELREVNLKATPARLAVLKVLENTDFPLDVASIKTELIKNGFNADPTTLFRMMNSFTDKKITREINLYENKIRYEHSSKAEHHHLICENCGLIEDISDCNIAILETEIARKKKFKVSYHALEFFGLCQQCQP